MRSGAATTPAKTTTTAIVLKATYPAVLCPLEYTTSGKEADIQVLRSCLSHRHKLKLKLYI